MHTFSYIQGLKSSCFIWFNLDFIVRTRNRTLSLRNRWIGSTFGPLEPVEIELRKSLGKLFFFPDFPVFRWFLTNFGDLDLDVLLLESCFVKDESLRRTLYLKHRQNGFSLWHFERVKIMPRKWLARCWTLFSRFFPDFLLTSSPWILMFGWSKWVS
jgi:hypothetical protein